MRVQGKIIAEIVEIVCDGNGPTRTATATAVAAKQVAILDTNSDVDGIQDHVHAKTSALYRSLAAEESTIHHDVHLRQFDVHRQSVHAVLFASVRPRCRLHQVGGWLSSSHLRCSRLVR